MTHTIAFAIEDFERPEAKPEKISKYDKICDQFYVYDNKMWFINKIQFTLNEKKLFCGDNTPGWKSIPDWQAIDFIKGFLNDRGYYNPEFINQDNKVLIKPGKITKIKSLIFNNAPKGLLEDKFLGVKAKKLNSDSLDQVEAWAITKMKTLGHPCPKVSVKADPRNGQLIIDLMPNEKVRITEIERQAPDGIRPFALSRYDAFKIGDYYDGINFDLTSRRLIASGIADYSDFDLFCEKESYDGKFKQRLTYSKPRSLVLAVGGTTEQFPVLKTSWKHSRLDINASQLEANLFLSNREQSISAFGHWHLFNNLPRLYFLPEISVARLDEIVYTSVVQQLNFGLGYMYDDSSRSVRIESKPTYSIEDRLDGAGPQHIEYLSLDSSMSIFDHDFEFNQQSPIGGYKLDLNWSFRQKGFGSDVSGNLYSLRGTYLLNWGGFDPPLYVLGFRFQYESLVTPNLFNLPSRYRLFLGGDNDLRGFSRKSINNDDIGFKTTAYIGAELRVLRVLPYNIQPFLFIDVGRIGLSSFQLEDSLLWSPGLGARWQSPIGAFRATAAKGLASSSVENEFGIVESWTYFISLGQEF